VTSLTVKARQDCFVTARIRQFDLVPSDDVLIAELVGELSHSQRQDAIGWLSAPELTRFESETIGRAESFLAGRWLLRALVATVLKCTPAEVLITAPCLDCGREHGAPQGFARGQKINLSLSHAGAFHIACASQSIRTGIDVELPRDAVDLKEWTIREAVAKLDGIGLRQSARDVPDLSVKTLKVSGLTVALACAP
jgi:phosphopantetheinyl transferase